MDQVTIENIQSVRIVKIDSTTPKNILTLKVKENWKSHIGKSWLFWMSQIILARVQTVRKITQQLQVPSDVVEHVLLPYLFVRCENSSEEAYLNDKTLNYLETAQVDYRHCHKCLLPCVIPDCYWRGRKEDFVGGLCPNHLEKENRWQLYLRMEEEVEEEFPQSSTFLCARCRMQIIVPSFLGNEIFLVYVRRVLSEGQVDLRRLQARLHCGVGVPHQKFCV